MTVLELFGYGFALLCCGWTVGLLCGFCWFVPKCPQCGQLLPLSHLCAACVERIVLLMRDHRRRE